jgi:type IV secretory pathway VirB10-like protein
MANLQYAQLPKFEYQTFERQYQTFDRQTLQFSFYPVTATSSDGLTSDKDQDITNNATNSEEGPSPESAPVEGSSSSPDDAAPAPESEGTYACQPPPSHFIRVHLAHIRLESSEAAAAPPQPEPSDEPAPEAKEEGEPAPEVDGTEQKAEDAATPDESETQAATVDAAQAPPPEEGDGAAAAVDESPPPEGDSNGMLADTGMHKAS